MPAPLKSPSNPNHAGTVRFGGVLDGTPFGLAMMLVWLSVYVTGNYLFQLELVQLHMAPAGDALHRTFVFAREALADILPMVPLFVVIANCTPATGFQR